MRKDKRWVQTRYSIDAGDEKVLLHQLSLRVGVLY